MEKYEKQAWQKWSRKAHTSNAAGTEACIPRDMVGQTEQLYVFKKRHSESQEGLLIFSHA